ncbi:hypothetical protein HPP92_015393 [Vanilla planifolia]|uniref:Uncharacterized protein n=1 Tax=Vanilla planifolia TaxID=51239 RepID=A0A835QXN9_VANPL|nr:hypothetical protein HPP92_015393 [Vanilla planifolia]
MDAVASGAAMSASISEVDAHVKALSTLQTKGRKFTRGGKEKGKHNTASSKLLSQAITAVCTVGSLVWFAPRLICMELEKSDCAALRNNILVVMIDFCVRYTALVDCYIPKITMTLRDPCEVVRKADIHPAFKMAPEHLFATSAKLCAEILAAASDGMLSIDDATGQSVVQDTLHILACKEMRIQSSKSQDTAEIDDECGESGESSALLAAKGRLVTQVAKKNLVQHAVPIFIELKRLLESKTALSQAASSSASASFSRTTRTKSTRSSLQTNSSRRSLSTTWRSMRLRR